MLSSELAIWWALDRTARCLDRGDACLCARDHLVQGAWSFWSKSHHNVMDIKTASFGHAKTNSICCSRISVGPWANYRWRSFEVSLCDLWERVCKVVNDTGVMSVFSCVNYAVLLLLFINNRRDYDYDCYATLNSQCLVSMCRNAILF